MSEFRNPLWAIIENVKHPDAQKLVWEQLNDVGRYNLQYVLGYYSQDVRESWLNAKDAAESKRKEQ